MIFRLNYMAIYAKLQANDASALDFIFSNKQAMQQDAIDFLNAYRTGRMSISQEDLQQLDGIMKISNIIYNNLDAMPPIEDGIYDQLMVAYKDLLPNNYQVGAIPCGIEYTGTPDTDSDPDGLRIPIQVVDTNDWLFEKELTAIPPFNLSYYPHGIDRSQYEKNVKSSRVIPHNYPKLVGTLDKCKFTLISEAAALGLDTDPTIRIFERDFLGKHTNAGLVDPYHIKLLLELKLDGMSVEADVTNRIISARSRGDTNLDIADDLTIPLGGYEFPNCPPISDAFGMKFEAIITKDNLERLSVLKRKPYKNARNAIVGLMGSTDAAAFKDLITLVPLETSLDIDPISEVLFMNRYYTKNVYLPYAVVEGDYSTVLFQVYKFVKEAEAMRPIANFLYDGVVVHYVDQNIRNALGRSNSVNQYSIAIKFNPMVKKTIFRGYTYSIGQNGVITPLAHYDPIEFLGTIHTKSSCHSYGRFRELSLAIGEVVEVAYVNEVMPYLSRPYEHVVGDGEANNPPIPFPVNCPCCGTPIVLSEDEASAYCPNFYCPERVIARLCNMMSKLNFKGFAESSIRKLNIKSFTELLSIPDERVIELLGTGNGNNFIEGRKKFLATPIQDYRLIGSLGFTNVASETWKKILTKASPLELIVAFKGRDLESALRNIKGIGTVTRSVILSEFNFFLNDIDTILHMPNVIYTYGIKQITVRWTGCRDAEFEEYLNSIGVDANSNLGVTSKTNIVVVPYVGYSSSKTDKATSNTIIVALNDFKANPQYYLNLV